jgi:hypothetical protein
MVKPQGYEETVGITDDIVVLPAGGYIVDVVGAESAQSTTGKDMLVLKLDIASGDFKGHFADMYKSLYDGNPETKWPCVYRQLVNDGNGKCSRFFKGLIACVEESNPGFNFNFDEATLKGKKLGMLFQREEYFSPTKGKKQWMTKASQPRSAKTIHEGKFKVPEDRPLDDGYAQAAMPGAHGFDSISTPYCDDDLPF